MSPSHTLKAGLKYRYYRSAALLHGQPEKAGSVTRVSAFEIEALVMATVRSHLKLPEEIDDRSLIEQHVARIEVEAEQLVIRLAQEDEADDTGAGEGRTLRVPWQKRASVRRREILVPSDATSQNLRPIRSETRAMLVASIARGRRWLDELMSNATATTQAIAKREGCSIRKVNMTVSLAFLALDLVKAAIEGRLPRGMGVSRLSDLPVEWSCQHQMLGLPER